MKDETTLKSMISLHNNHYRLGNPQITDTEYDNLLEDLESIISPEEMSEFRKTLLDIPGKVKHNYVIGSLNKAKADTDQLDKWINKHNIKEVVEMEKIDGLSIVIEYRDSVFQKATTRGDGEHGENQTDKIRHVVPTKLKNNFTGQIRAEITLTHETFEILKQLEPEKNHKNLRNSASGIINSKDVDVEKLSLLSVICYQILGSDSKISSQLLYLYSMGLETCAWKVVSLENDGDVSNDTLKETLATMKENARYDVDGIVICDANYIGENVYHPEKMIAFKVDDESEITTVEEIEWNVSKQGYVKPVVIVNPVELNGTTVKRATAYNAKWLFDHKIGVGAEVEIIKSGEIIPKIINVVKEGKETTLDFCPCCGSVLEKYTPKDDLDDWTELKCNNIDCPDVNVKLLESFLLKMNVEGVSETSLRNWNIMTFEGLFNWIPNNSLKSQISFYKEILHKILKASKEDLISAMYFEGAGRKTIKKLIAEFGFDVLSEKMNESEMSEDETVIEGIGAKTWNKIRERWNLNVDLLNIILNDFRYKKPSEKDDDAPVGNTLYGKSFCFTGKISKPRSEYEQMVKDNAGEIKGVSKNLDYLVVGEKAGSKLAKAQKVGVKILTESDFLSMLGIKEEKVEDDIDMSFNDIF